MSNEANAIRLRNPDWSFEETVLLLDLYLQRPKAHATDPRVIALSRFLNVAAARRGGRREPTFRNSNGVAMKLRNLAQQDPVFRASGRRGLRGGVRLDAEVWARFAGDPIGLASEVARIRKLWALAGHTVPHALGTVSKGPPPAFGKIPMVRTDQETEVYVLQLDGPIAAIFPDRSIGPREAVIKIGRSSDIVRRCAELNFGLPPSGALVWRPLASRRFAGAALAHLAEQRLLDLAEARGWALSGEFVIAPIEELLRELDRLEAPTSAAD